MMTKEYTEAFIEGIKLASQLIAVLLAKKDIRYLPNGNILRIIEEELTNDLIDNLRKNMGRKEE